VSLWPDCESLALIWRLVAVPTFPLCDPGLFTVTVLATAGLIFQENEAEPLAPVVSVAVTVTLEVAAAVGVPLISPVLELMLSPAGRPDAL
jgi:hypothetical protein